MQTDITQDERQARRRGQKLELQKQRRARYRRIDYYPSKAAAKTIDSMLRPKIGGDYSGVINSIIEEWMDEIPEFNCKK